MNILLTMTKRHLLNTVLVVFFLVFCYLASPGSSLHILKPGDFLNSSSQLVSANQNFTLGFYNPDPSNYSTDTYLAIQLIDGHPVWIGNRNTPIQNNSAVLTIDSHGNLIIKINESTTLIALYSSQTSTNATATLLDTGNFVLQETSSNGSKGKVLWQSFDYPTDTLLPGMKLGVNHRTGLNWTLTSWFSDTKPRDGAFSLDWDTMKLRLIVRRRGVIYWTSGVLKDKVFEFFYPDDSNFNYIFISERNADEEYFSYYNSKSTWFEQDWDGVSISSGWQLDYLGRVFRNGVSIVQVDFCYGFNNTRHKIWDNIEFNGCELREQPKCRSSTQNFTLRTGGFQKRGSDGNLNYFGGDSDSNSSLSLSDCRDICWKDCDCVGYKAYGIGYGCEIWRGPNVEFEQDLSGYAERKYILSEAEAEAEAPDKKKWRIIVIAVVVSVAILLFALLCYLKRKIRQGKAKKLLELMTLDGYTNTIVLEKDGKKGQDLKFFSYSCIVASTNSFSSENKLGEGGFGPVYKGKLPEGQEIAVKLLSKRSGQGLHEFKTELVLIAKLQHTNLVRLFGCCIHREEKMLIYEYMPNRSLDFLLFDQTNSMQLSWKRRFVIIEGIAQGLLYLHKYSRLRIVHRDLKASNILLDENMNPKISDFGTARIFKNNLSEENTNKITGTRGYMAPEYLMKGTFSMKSDVYSFGVLMLEIVSGRKNNSFYDLEGPLNLVAYASELWNRNAAIQLMDPALHGSSTIHDQFLRYVHIGLLCVQHTAVDRPTMSDVISMISPDSSALPLPKPPAFFRSPTTIEENIDRRKSEKVSVNGLSISEIGAR